MKKSSGKDILRETLNIQVQQLKMEFEKLINSWRWKVGNKLITILEAILGRNGKWLSTYKIEGIIKSLEMLASYSLPGVRRLKSIDKLDKISFICHHTDDTLGHGDVITASELASAFKNNNGVEFEIFTIKNVRSEHLGDVCISMIWDAFIPDEFEGLRIAWIRQYPENWLMNHQIRNYDLVLAASSKIKAFVEACLAKPVYLFPIAVNPRRFYKTNSNKKNISLLFTGNRWGEKRTIEWFTVEELKELGIQVAGYNWEDQVSHEYLLGPQTYESLNDLYNQSDYTLDDANASCRKWHSVNSRVYDAILAGSLVITNNKDGIDNQFIFRFPTFSTADDLLKNTAIINNSPEERSMLVKLLQEEINEFHTSDKRAKQLKSILENQTNSINISYSTQGEDFTYDQLGIISENLLKAFNSMGLITTTDNGYLYINSDTPFIQLSNINLQTPITLPYNQIPVFYHFSPGTIPFNEKINEVLLIGKPCDNQLNPPYALEALFQAEMPANSGIPRFLGTGCPAISILTMMVTINPSTSGSFI